MDFKKAFSLRFKMIVAVLVLGVFALLFGIYIPPHTEAVVEKKALGVENYDIRTDDRSEAKQILNDFRAFAGKNETAVGEARQTIEAGEKILRDRVPYLKIEHSGDLNVPEIIAADAVRDKPFLTIASKSKRREVLRSFVKSNELLFGLSDEQSNDLRIVADYTNPDGNLSFAHLAQFVGGVQIFNGEIKAGFTRRGELFRVVNNLAPALDYANLSKEFGSPETAFFAAARNINRTATAEDVKQIAADDLKITFARGQFARESIAEKIYFPTEIGVARTAWQVLLWEEDAAFYVVVDAETGTLLWRKNISAHQTQPATYNVYGNATSALKTADSPAPYTPGPNQPDNSQAPLIPRTNFTLIGNEPPYTFNSLGWIPDNVNETNGNNAEAGIDRDGTDGIDPNGKAYGNQNRVFSYVYNPGPGNPAPGEEPLPSGQQPYPPTAFQQGAITNAFYVANCFHDETYLLGFTEAARNFQNDNFGRGGAGNDGVTIEIQDSVNGGSFASPADGGRGKLQLGLFTGSTPDRDMALDAHAVVHELTHGLSNRLHGNGTGLGGNMAAGMGEGWSDFYALALLSEPSDNPLGTQAFAGYLTYQLTSPTDFHNYYYGLRRFPYAVIASTGANGRPHNPLTFGHLNPNCNTVIGSTTTAIISAFPRGPVGASQCDQVHNAGEIWGSVLWEMRGQLVQTNGAAIGNRKALQFVTDAMKLAPLNPTMLQERDAILSAAAVSGTAQDVRDIWRGFALRGFGFSARINSTSPANIVQSFDTPNVVQSPQFTFSDAMTGDGDGYAEPGETIVLTVPLTNPGGETAANTILQLAGTSDTANYGNIPAGQTVTRSLNFTVPTTIPCGQEMLELNFTVNNSLGTVTFVRQLRVGIIIGGPPVTHQNAAAITINDNASAAPYPSQIAVSGVTGGTVNIKVNLRGLTHTYPADIDVLLVAPGGQKMIIMSDLGGGDDVSNINVTLTDRAVNSLPTALLTSGEYKPGNTGANDLFPAPAPATPYSNPAPAGADTFASAFGTNGTAMNGTWSLYIVDDAGTDTGQIANGWSLTFEPQFIICIDQFNKARADFDGDGKTDISVFRNGTWYINRSGAGFTAWNWGLPSDRILAGDFDNDGKADSTVFRTANGATTFYVLKSSNFSLLTYSWGAAGDVPVIGDYDGDGETDAAVFRPSNSTFYILKSSGGITSQHFGQNGDIPVTGDFDGDGKSDVAVYRTNTWYVLQSRDGFKAVQFGAANDKPVPAAFVP